MTRLEELKDAMIDSRSLTLLLWMNENRVEKRMLEMYRDYQVQGCTLFHLIQKALPLLRSSMLLQ